MKLYESRVFVPRLSAVRQIYEFYIFISYPLHLRVYIKLTNGQTPWLDSSVVERLHRYRRGHGFESRSSHNFFSGLLFSTALSWVHYCEDISFA